MSDDEARSDRKSKKDKKEKKEKHSSDDKPRKAEKEKRASDDSERITKKRKLSEGEESSSKKHAEDKEEFESQPRRRTRSMSEAEDNNRIIPNQNAEEFRKSHQITVTGVHEGGSGPYSCPAPMTTFESTPFAQPLRRALDAAGFASPTPTQAQSWPIALAGRDIITVAKTGSGKTCGFLLPAFHRLMTAGSNADRKRGPPAILVLAPTRELACQIEEEAIKFGRTSNMRTVCAYGGSPKSLQIRKIQAGVEVLIATPGRLNDLLEMKVVNLSQVLFLVLDEADRM